MIKDVIVTYPQPRIIFKSGGKKQFSGSSSFETDETLTTFLALCSTGFSTVPPPPAGLDEIRCWSSRQ
jgi:hypothetical protein